MELRVNVYLFVSVPIQYIERDPVVYYSLPRPDVETITQSSQVGELVVHYNGETF